jgi:4-hydroxyproline epimerase
VAYGGNWFFLVHEPAETITPDQIPRLTAISERIRKELADQGITGANGAEIDHVEMFGPSEVADSRNFVLCPGSAYDRSPCGTGTSAKLACLVADGKLSEHQVWRQESVTGGLFYGNAVLCEDGIIPTIRGRAFITAESTLILDPRDPYRWGIGA